MFHVNLKCADDSYVSLFATEIPTICAPVYRPDIPLHVLQSFEELSIEADCSDGGEVQVDVLIGLDSYWKFMKSGIVRNTGGLVAQESVFGWVLSGSLVDDGGSPSVVSHQLLCFNEVPEAALHKFWDLESIGISDAPVEAADVSSVFKQHIKRVDPMDQDEQLVPSEVWIKGPKFIRDRSGNLEITTGLAGVEQNVSSVVMLVLSLLVSMSSFTVSVVMLVLSLLVSMSSFTVSSVVMLVLSLLASMSSFTVSSVVMLVLSLLVSMSSNTVSVVMLVLSLLVSMSSFTVSSVVMLVLPLLVSMSSFTVSVVMLVLSLLVSMSSFTVSSVVMLVLSLLVSMSSFTVSSVVMLVLSLLVSMRCFTVSSVVMLVLSLLVSMSSFTVSYVVMLVLSLLVSMSSVTVSVVMLVLSLLVSMSSFTVSSVVMLVLSLLVSMSSFTVSVVMLVLSLLVSMSSFTVSVVMLVFSLLVSMSSFTVSVVMLVLSLLVSMSSFVLCGDACIVLADLYEHPVTAKDLVARYKVRSQLVDHFWDIWSSDYIRNLPACQGDTERGHLSVGSVVLVREGCYSRMQWPIGVITRVYPGRDGIIRAVEVRTAKGTYVRSIQLLHDLEITESTECDKETPLTVTDTDDSNHVFQSSESQYVTRYGRSVKPVKKLNL